MKEHLGSLHLNEGLELNQRQLGNMEELLLSVQTDMNAAEKKLFGKVFDLESERNFLATHQELVSQNAELKDGMQGLNDNIATLSAQLDSAQRQFLSVKHQEQKAGGHLKEQVAENDFTITGLQKELVKAPLIQKDNDRLVEMRKALAAEETEITAVAREAHKELGEATASLTKERGVIQPNLQKQLVSQHKYGVGCHAKVKQLDTQLRAVLAAKPLQNSAEKAAALHAARSDEAVDQRLSIENQFLKQQVAHAEAALAGLQETDRAAEAKLAQLKAEIAAEHQAVMQAMSNLREHMTTMQEAMQQNIDTRKTKEATLILEADVLSDLQQRMSSSGVDNLKNENAKLKVMLQQSQGKLQKSQGVEAEAKAFEQEKVAENSALQQTAHMSQNKAEEAMAESQKQVADAAKDSEKTQAKAQAITNQAEAAVAAKCKPVWDGRTKKAEEKLEKCHDWKDELLAANAEVETLKVSLEAAGLKI